MSSSRARPARGRRSLRLPRPAYAFLAAAFLAVLLADCTLPDYPNQPLPDAARNHELAPLPPGERPDEPVILMAFSGGGARAAALSLDILRQLRRYDYVSPTTKKPVRLIDRVKVVSSVSGGSVTAAYFGLHPDRIDDIESQFLVEDNMSTLEWTAANPVTWGRLALAGYTRLDAARDLFNQRLFDGMTFADLNKSPDRPTIILNATDMVSGDVFAFTPDRFDDICSELDPLPVAVGVASSAAFPIVLSPMDLKNYAHPGCPQLNVSDQWIANNINMLYPRYLALEEYKRAQYANSLRRNPGALRDIEYVHLLDGGLADNQGVRSLMDVMVAPHGPVNLINEINLGHRKRIIVIVVNARSDPQSDLDQDGHTPGIFQHDRQRHRHSAQFRHGQPQRRIAGTDQRAERGRQGRATTGDTAEAKPSLRRIEGLRHYRQLRSVSAVAKRLARQGQ